MNNLRADMHVHTYYSDGILSPQQVVSAAKCNGVNVLAVTDHDGMYGCEEVKKFCIKEGIAAVDGAEISAYAGDIKVHTLCYNPDKENADLKAFLKELAEGSVKRTEEIIFKLSRLGIKLTMEEVVAERFCSDAPIHTFHIARAAAKKGYAKIPGDFYIKYLNSGMPAFTNAYRPTPEQTVEIITAAGGVSSVAHPGRIDMNALDLKAMINRLKGCGLCGIEAVYSAHTAKETAYYKELAKATGLLVTGGSDTHYFDRKKKIGTPYFVPDEQLCLKLGI